MTEETRGNFEQEQYRQFGQVFYLGSWVQNELREVKQEIREVRQDLKSTETALRQEIKAVETGLRQEMKQEITGLRQEMRQEITSLRQEIKGFFWAVVGIALASLAVSISVAVKIWQ
ncbi:MAG: hypothetical protein K6U74_00415 [Firmicutes bacterium]|nr:hypothetical protein [Bacillota bacterium]